MGWKIRERVGLKKRKVMTLRTRNGNKYLLNPAAVVGDALIRAVTDAVLQVGVLTPANREVKKILAVAHLPFFAFFTGFFATGRTSRSFFFAAARC
jgi:hypothetical protein